MFLVDKLRPYWRFPSELPYAWLIYMIAWTILLRIYALLIWYRPNNYWFTFSYLGIVFIITIIFAFRTYIQIIINVYRLIKRKEKLFTKKVLISILLLLGMYYVVNPLLHPIIHYFVGNVKLFGSV
jgi:hypothetical protein